MTTEEIVQGVGVAGTEQMLRCGIYGLLLCYLLICARGAFLRLRASQAYSAPDLHLNRAATPCASREPFRSMAICLYLAALAATQLCLHFG